MEETPQIPHPAHKKWIILVTLCLAVFITVLDSTLLNVSLPTIVKDFHTTIKNMQWVISAYSLLLASLTITGGRLGDFYGRKKMFMLGALIFAVGSFMTSISHNIPTMIWGESIIEGIGAALMVPSTAALIVSNFEGRDRALAFGLWTGFASVAAAVGPILGGYFTTNYTWRYGFRINLFVVALLLLGALMFRDSKSDLKKPRLDYGGVLLSSLSLFLMVFGIIEASVYGWFRPKEIFNFFGLHFSLISICPVALFAGLWLLYAFFRWEKYRIAKNLTPLVDPDLFQNTGFTTGLMLTFMIYLGFVGVTFAVPIMLQSIAGASAFTTGLALVPYSISIFAGSQISAFISKWIKPQHLIQAGMVTDGIGLLILRGSINPGVSGHSLIAGLSVCGLGIGLTFAQFTNLTLSAVPVNEAGEASGIFNTIRQMGVSFAIAITGTVLVAGIAANLVSGVAASPKLNASDRDAALRLLASNPADVEFGGTQTLTKNLSTKPAAAVTAVAHKAISDSVRHALEYNFAFICIAFAASFLLYKRAGRNQAETANQHFDQIPH